MYHSYNGCCISFFWLFIFANVWRNALPVIWQEAVIKQSKGLMQIFERIFLIINNYNLIFVLNKFYLCLTIVHYTLNQLQIFLKVCETQSVTLASEALHLTQPAVSIQLKNFQDQFDVPLTEIVGRKIYITPFGLEIAEAAKKILEQVYAINYKTQAYKGQLIGKLKIAMVSSGKYLMPFYLSGFLKKNETVDLELDVSNKSKVVERIQSNSIDFALVSVLPENLLVEKIELIQNKLYFMGPSRVKVPEDASGKINFNQLPLIYREKGSSTRQLMERFIEQKHISVNKKLELTSNEAIKQAMLAGLGYSLISLIGLKNELLNNELQPLNVKGMPIKKTWCIIWPKGKKHSPVAQAFLNYLKTHKEQIHSEHFKWYLNYK